MATAAPVSVRRARTFGPSPARDKIPTHPQRQWPGLLRVPFFERRPDLDAPLLDHRLIALGRAFDGQLRCPAQALQEARDMRLVIQDTKLLPDDRGHAGARPHLAPKAVCLRTMGEQ